MSVNFIFYNAAGDEAESGPVPLALLPPNNVLAGAARFKMATGSDMKAIRFDCGEYTPLQYAKYVRSLWETVEVPLALLEYVDDPYTRCHAILRRWAARWRIKNHWYYIATGPVQCWWSAAPTPWGVPMGIPESMHFGGWHPPLRPPLVTETRLSIRRFSFDHADVRLQRPNNSNENDAMNIYLPPGTCATFVHRRKKLLADPSAKKLEVADYGLRHDSEQLFIRAAGRRGDELVPIEIPAAYEGMTRFKNFYIHPIPRRQEVVVTQLLAT